jgi:hypothetical protein
MMAGRLGAHMVGTVVKRQSVDFRSHSFLASHLHTAATTGGDQALVALAVVFGCSVLLFAVAWFTRGADDESGPGGGGGGPQGPERPPNGPSWWPDFEREFARYAASLAAGRQRSRDSVRAVGHERTPVPPGT